jgi:hypothetical protein
MTAAGVEYIQFFSPQEARKLAQTIASCADRAENKPRLN